MSVTVCIPCYGQQDTLQRALESVYEQSMEPLEVLVIDDGSPEPISIPCRKPYVRLIRVTNRGLPNARNVGIMNARGAGFIPLDADDWLGPDYIRKTFPKLIGGADVVLTGLREHGPTRNKMYMPGYDMAWDQVTGELMLNTFNRFFYASLYRTSLLREIGGYNGRMNLGLEDYDLNVDLLRRGAKFDAVMEVLFHYDTSNPNSMLQQITRNGGFEQMRQEMMRHHV